MEFLYWTYLRGALFLQLCLPFHFFYIPMWLGIQMRMMLLFLEVMFILSRSLVMRVDEFFLSSLED